MNPSDEKVDQLLGNLLRTGVLLSVAVVLLGTGDYLIHHGRERHNYQQFRGEPAQFRSPASILRDARSFDSRAILMVGILILLATPFARVAFSLAAFLLQKDWIYAVVTLIVLAVLAYSLF
jgi:uncharacterized membrane protein